MVVTHIPGEDNVVADAFSRQLDLTQEQINVLSANVIMGLYELELDTSSPIPDKLYQHIAKVHNTAVGHHGAERTMAKVCQRLSQVDPDLLELPQLREYVRTFI